MCAFVWNYANELEYVVHFERLFSKALIMSLLTGGIEH